MKVTSDLETASQSIDKVTEKAQDIVKLQSPINQCSHGNRWNYIYLR